MTTDTAIRPFTPKAKPDVKAGTDDDLFDWLADYRSRISNALWIVPKHGGDKIKLVPNDIQSYYLDHACYSPYQTYELTEAGFPISPWTGEPFTFRNLELKPRQVGMSTIVLANKVTRIISEPNRNLALIAQDETMRDEFRERAHAYLEQYGKVGECPRYGSAAGAGRLDNKDRLDFGNGSTIYFQSAQAPNIGRTVTFHDVYGTEVAFWDMWGEGTARKIVHALNASVPPPPYGTVDFESTANGAAGVFYDLVMGVHGDRVARRKRHEFDWQLFFWEWWIHKEYRLDGVNLGTLSNEEKELRAVKGLDYGQIAWRRKEKRLAETMKKLFESEYPEDLVQCFISGRDTVIPAPVLFKMREFCVDKEPIRTEYDGDLRIFEGPEPGKVYILGGDGAEGVQGKDQSAFVITRRDTMEPVVLYNGYMPAHDMGRLMARMGFEYNQAYIAAESNNTVGYALNNALEQLHYPNLHYREDPEYNRMTQPGIKNPFALGWQTNVKTRSEMIELLREYLIGTLVLIRDRVLVDQISTFIWRTPESNTHGALRPEAASGAKDDLLFAYMITLAVRDYASDGTRRAPARRY
jgi:hypothetical protein